MSMRGYHSGLNLALMIGLFLVGANMAAAQVITNNVNGNINVAGNSAVSGCLETTGSVRVGMADTVCDEALTIGRTFPIAFHSGGSKAIMFNAAYDPIIEKFRYIGRNTRDSAWPAMASAQVIFADLINAKMFINVMKNDDADTTFTIDANKGLQLDADGNVGIGVNNAESRLHINGALSLENIAVDPLTSPARGFIYCKDGVLRAKDAGGNITQFSSHKNPKEIDIQAITSFEDMEIKIPFSFHHQNVFIGKGAVVDMAKMIAYIEDKMQEELGEEAGRLVFMYDLPMEMCMTEEDYEVENLLSELDSMKNIKVDLGPDGAIPDEALEYVEEEITFSQSVRVKEKVLDMNERRVKEIEKEKVVPVTMKTGRMTSQFKEGWAFIDGRLYRKPTLDDLDVDAIINKRAGLPQWVKDRMSQGKNSGQQISDLVEEIKNRLEANLKEKKAQEVASVVN